MISILFTVFSSVAFSLTPCDQEFLKSSVCKVEWQENQVSNSLHLTKESNACEFPEGNRQDCARLVHCKAGQLVEIGATVILEKANADAFCLPSQPFDLFVSSRARGPSAFVECKKRKAISVRLVTPTQESTICKFPQWKKK